MRKKEEDILIEHVRNKLDAFIQKGVELYEGFDVTQRNKLIKKVLGEILNDAIDKIRKEYNEDELIMIEKNLKEFTSKYYERKMKQINRKEAGSHGGRTQR